MELRNNYLENEPVETIYFGGGTPSQLSHSDFEKIFTTLNKEYDIQNCGEITIEANPDDLTPEYINKLTTLPFNRISIGMQTFNDKLLRLLNRRHTANQAIRAVEECRKAGFRNISIDLMYGLPGETLKDWVADLETAISLNPEHISAYHLIYEEGTPLYKMLQKQQITEVNEELSVSFFSLMIERLTQAGYQHYEISNFCKPDMYSRHNSSYWTGKKYLGCGPSAHSFNGESRQWNVSSLEQYLEGIECGAPCFEVEPLDTVTRYNDFVITSLRTMWGLPLAHLKEEFGEELLQYCLGNAKNYLESGKLEIKDNTLFLTKEGIFISDGIMSDLLWVEEE
ncbi:coproporphyrinogen III oxidase [Bacteroides sedimenti]|uniref:Heme chaperone HemW n=1 Tax=Bacteroides sedimenti TaxID=2136147 RepID=A0ABN6Z4U2_9BACE